MRALGALFLLACALALNNFAAALGLGVSGAGGRTRTALLFGGFETGMPLLGIALGAAFARAWGPDMRWAGVALLTLAGAHGWIAPPRPALRAPSLWIVALVASLDNLAAGLALGAVGPPRWLAVLVIGVVSAALSLLGFELGRRIGRRLGPWCERCAAALLIVAAAVMALQ